MGIEDKYPGEVLFPIRLYIYNEEGKHDDPTWLRNETELYMSHLLIWQAIRSGREIVMTDPGDRTVLHAKGGKVLFPPQGSVG